MAADPQAAEVQQLASLLSALTQPDTNTIRQAELQLKPVLKNPASMMILWQIISNTQNDVALRHVSAIVLRKRLPSHYANWDANSKLQWQNQVLNALAVEQIRPVRAGLAGVSAALAQVRSPWEAEVICGTGKS